MSHAKAQRAKNGRNQLGELTNGSAEQKRERWGGSMTENELASIVVDTCVAIHKKLGPGLLESAYESILCFELGKRGLVIERQVPVSLTWEGMLVDISFRIDILVEKKLIVELKSIEKTLPVHKKQVLTYLRIMDIKLGLLINFGAELMKEGIVRVVNGLSE
jgi:GxxExxY protein